MNNQIRRELLNRHRQSGFPGSIMDVFSAYNAGRDIISEFIQERQRQQQLQQMQQMQQQQSQPIVANTPEEQEQGLRPYHEAGQTDQSMVFPNVPANTPFNTVGMKAPINIDKYDNQGHLIESFKSVPPGIQNLPTGPQEGTVVETPANMQSGGVRRYQYAGPVTEAPRVPALSDAEMSLKIIQEANAGNPAARRMRSDYGQRMFLPGETSPSTHYMASFDNYAVPTVQEEYIGGPLKYNPNPNPGKEDFRFDTPEQAAYFSNNYKNASASKALYRQPEDMQTGGVRRYQTAGPRRNSNAEITTLQPMRTSSYEDPSVLARDVPVQSRYVDPGVRRQTQDQAFQTLIHNKNVEWSNPNTRANMLSGKADNIAPSTYITPVGDLGQILESGIQISKGDYIGGGLGMGLGALSAILPGTLKFPGSKIVENTVSPAFDIASEFSENKFGGVRKYQKGGGKNVDPFSSFEIAKHMARIHGGTPQQFLALSDTSGYHESDHTLDPKMVQRGSGIAKGAFQIEASTIPRLQQRVRQYAEQTGNEVPSWINIPNNDARNLSLDRQRALFLLDMNYSEGTNMRAYAQGKTTSAEQWLRGWKRKEAADGKDIERFETSANKARQMGIPNSALTEFNRMVQDKKPTPTPNFYQDLVRPLIPLNKHK